MVQLLSNLRSVAHDVLQRTYRRDEQLFAFRLRCQDDRDSLEGISRRYTAMVLLGLATETPESCRRILDGADPVDICDRMISDIAQVENMGDVATILWAARVHDSAKVEQAYDRLLELSPIADYHPTVERAWALTALSVRPDTPLSAPSIQQLADGLVAGFEKTNGTFPHYPGARKGGLRAHVSCFADWVYPIQALAHHAIATDDDRIREIVRSAASRMCEMQGDAGQWWWHFDSRNGTVVESYPVYAVHQDAMAPMALFAAEDACDADYGDAIRRGLDWLEYSPEISGSLIDRHANVVWRKVGRSEPGKLTRAVQAFATATRLGWRLNWLDHVFTPERVDFETRPYHMGWLLYAWPEARVSEFAKRWEGVTQDEQAPEMADAASL